MFVVRFQEVTQWQTEHTGRTDEGYARCGMSKCMKASDLYPSKRFSDGSVRR